ncbi:F-box protein [Trifolium repens]|nr:F-box protein [Trifolium repens]
MKRKKDSIYPTRASQRCNKAKGKVDDDETQNHQLCPYFANIPSHLVAQILLQLPIKSLVICKCVCKMWKTLISEPHFAKLHFEKTPVNLLIRKKGYIRVSRTLYLLECEPEKFEIGSDNRVKLQPIFKLPLCDARLLREKMMYKLNRPVRAVRLALEKNKNSDGGSQMLNINIRPYDDKFGVVKSCNGLLCLCSPEGNPLVICNPATGEFIRLPKAINTPNRLRLLEPVGFGFGFQPKTNEYKVIQMWKKVVRNAYPQVLKRMILEIYTLGTPSWRNVEVDPQVSNSRLKYPTCLNGVIHWIRFEGQNRSMSILCFCLESERLQSFPSPPDVFGNHHRISRNERISMGGSRGLLYICDTSSFHDGTMWVMNEYGIGESWTKVYNIDTSISSLGRPDKHGLCWPLKHFEDGASMLSYHSCNCLIYYEPENYGFKVFQIHGSPFVEIIPHIPSIISLKDIVKGDNIEVLNIYSMCANVKLREENEVLSLSQFGGEEFGDHPVS